MDISLLKDIVILLIISTLINVAFVRIKVPTIVGYLLTGILLGPHLLGLIQAQHEIEMIAEIGVVLLLFTIGMEFSLKHLLKIRKVVFFGGLFQVFVTAGVFMLVSKIYDLPWQTGLFIGFLAALSSSALVLKLLQERSELTSNYGRTTLGILIFQDLMLVPILLLTNFLGSESSNITYELSVLTIKMVIIIAFVYVGNRWLIPKLLHMVALLKNQELFMLAIFMICMAVSLITFQLGMSLAFGAFLAGLMISESEYSHNAFGNLITFKDVFTSFFFISIGMMLDMSFVVDNYPIVIASVLLLLGIKTIVGGATGFILGHTFRGTVMIGLALCQVGEFSFILAKIGFKTSIINDFYYQLFLAVAVITITVTPFVMNISMPLSNLLLKLPLPKVLINGLFPLKEIEIPHMNNHLVIIGKDSTAMKLSIMAKHIQMPHISVIFDPTIVRDKLKNGDVAIYGDAINLPILYKAHVDSADIVIISVGSAVPTMAIIESVRKISKSAHIIVRAQHVEMVEQFYKLGADQVIPQSFELAIDLFHRVLSKRLIPLKETNRIISSIRSDYLGVYSDKDLQNQASILEELSHIEISAIKIEEFSELVGKNLQDSQLRNRTGVTLLAVKRGKTVIEHPNLQFVFNCNDIAFVLGSPEQVNAASELFSVG